MTLSAFSGLLTENTTRGFGWLFLEIGRRMERALQTAELLSSGLASAPSDFEPHLQVLLQIADSSITYRTRYPTVVQAESVLEVLMTDESNPRAVAFQLATLLQQVERLQEIAPGKKGKERELASKALAAVRKATCCGSRPAQSGRSIWRAGRGHRRFAMDALRDFRCADGKLSESSDGVARDGLMVKE